MFKKRVLSLISLILVLGLIFTGCVNNTETDADTDEPVETEETVDVEEVEENEEAINSNTGEKGQPEENVGAEVYEGTAKGHNGDIKVAVTIEGREITDLELVEHEETDGHWEDAFDTIKNHLLEHQDLDVDAVAGATVTSDALVEAIKDALKDTDIYDITAN